MLINHSLKSQLNTGNTILLRVILKECCKTIPKRICFVIVIAIKMFYFESVCTCGRKTNVSSLFVKIFAKNILNHSRRWKLERKNRLKILIQTLIFLKREFLDTELEKWFLRELCVENWTFLSVEEVPGLKLFIVINQ